MTEILKRIFSFNGIAVAIGVAGSLASLLSLFNQDWNFQVNVKWIIFLVFLFSSITIVFVKIIFDLRKELQIDRAQSTFRIIKYEPTQEAFLIEKTNALGPDAVVSLFYLQDEFELDFGKAFVSNIQDKFIQLQTFSITDKFAEKHADTLLKIKNNDAKTIKNVIIKTYVTRNS